MTETGLKLTEEEWKVLAKMVHDWGLIDEYFETPYPEAMKMKNKFKGYLSEP